VTAETRYTRLPRTTLWLLRGDDFTMGGDADDEQPRFEASARPIYIGKVPITNIEYEAYDPGHTRGESSLGDEQPVVGVSHGEATDYCRWYSEASGKQFRLPTELEWEFACRAGCSERYFWGSQPGDGDAYVWDARNAAGATLPTEGKLANEFGLYDMLGNVWEWTSSLYRPYPVLEDDGRDAPEHPGDRVARGGSFRTDREDFGSSTRLSLPPNSRRDDLGFRIVRFL